MTGTHPEEEPQVVTKSIVAEKKEELSEEDQQLVETLGMLVERLQDADSNLHRPALEALRTQIRSSAVSLTSIPKALKYLRHHYTRLVTIHSSIPVPADQASFSFDNSDFDLEIFG